MYIYICVSTHTPDPPTLASQAPAPDEGECRVLDAGAEAVAGSLPWVARVPCVGWGRLAESLLRTRPKDVSGDAGASGVNAGGSGVNTDVSVERRLALLLSILQAVGCTGTYISIYPYAYT